MKQRRVIYVIIMVSIVILGILSRRFPQFVPAALGKYPGDALWAMVVFFGLRLLFPNLTACAIGLMGFAFSFAIEFSQLYQAPWIDSVRSTTVGYLILGRGFLWTDILAYAFGIGLACILDVVVLGNRMLR